MQEFAISISNLNKSFKNFHAVNDLSLQVEEGEIYGFLGPNGAGKSTTIRMMLSLIKQDSGTISFFGEELTSKNRNIFRNIGALVEKPDFYLYLSAYRNLQLFGEMSGVEITKTKIYDILELVGLGGRVKDKVKTYSLGMKQRLGLAQALIHNPKIIILDEPTNGLDPQGMKEIKDLLIDLSTNQKKTIFLSSHILREVETMATSMAIINNGKTLVQGKVKELLDNGLNSVTVKIREKSNLTELLTELSNQLKLNSKEEYNGYAELVFELSNEEIPQMVNLLVTNGCEIMSVSPVKSLEEYFLKLTGGII
ncbi:MAG: ABC transporter ATP-binding protein [Candidatus Kapaibacteriota bacterium]|jgi:ABC-type multidrug transport system ATPase subunit